MVSPREDHFQVEEENSNTVGSELLRKNKIIYIIWCLGLKVFSFLVWTSHLWSLGIAPLNEGVPCAYPFPMVFTFLRVLQKRWAYFPEMHGYTHIYLHSRHITWY